MASRRVLAGWAADFCLRRIVGLFLSGGASAMTLGHVVLGRDLDLLDATRSHERLHVRQCERWGPFFVPVYFLASLVAMCRGKRAYEDNFLERRSVREGCRELTLRMEAGDLHLIGHGESINPILSSILGPEGSISGEWAVIAFARSRWRWHRL